LARGLLLSNEAQHMGGIIGGQTFQHGFRLARERPMLKI
jgi:hypothetical protein